MDSHAAVREKGYVHWPTKVIEEILLLARYLLVPLYCALMFLIGTIILDFFEILTNTAEVEQITEHTLRALELLDITMVANLIWFIAAGSYYVFVHPYPDASTRKRPRSLTNISTGILKEKMAGSLIGVSSVNLLQLFLNISVSEESVDIQKTGVLIAIHITFIFGLLAFNYANKADHHVHEPRPQDP